MMQETIAAIATPPGAGSVAIIRISGCKAFEIAAGIFSRQRGVGIPRERRVYVGKLLDAVTRDPIDEGLVFGMRAPRSYTGEDVVEIQCHGGSLVSARVLESVCRAGARPAAPGEFTKRAFLNGRFDLAQAEAVADLIAARTDAGARLAWSQLDGTLSARVEKLRDSILRARAMCEVVLDFPDEDTPEMHADDVRAELRTVRHELTTLAETFDRGRVRYEGARVALVGRPNVGKSSLLNALTGRERALVSDVAGTTRDVLEATIVVNGSPVVITDTAGIRKTMDAIEAMGVDRSRSVVGDSACVLPVFDASDVLNADDDLVASVVAGRPSVAVLNKTDLPPRSTRREVEGLLGGVPVVSVSALTREGFKDLASAIASVVFGAVKDGRDDEVVIFRARHYEAVRDATAHLSRAEDCLQSQQPLELVAVDLAAAAAALAAITGDITSEDVLDRVFADFCLGK